MLHIPCKAGAQALVDVISGKLPMAFVIHTQALPHMRSGVEGIVADIDDIVKKVRFPDWQHTTQDKRLVQKELRKTLLRYRLHTDQDLFDRAYAYIKQYY